jgi:hypothetical protein
VIFPEKVGTEEGGGRTIVWGTGNGVLGDEYGKEVVPLSCG